MWAGLDLAASPRRPSGLAVGDSWDSLRVYTVYDDSEVLDALREAVIVWVDAPLSVGSGAFRDCDRRLQAEGIMPLPLTWRSMQRLHQRALVLRQAAIGTEWRETFPWSVYRWLGAPSGRKKDPTLLATWCREMGFTGTPLSVHEWDAIACWSLGWLVQQGEARCIRGDEGAVWIP